MFLIKPSQNHFFTLVDSEKQKWYKWILGSFFIITLHLIFSTLLVFFIGIIGSRIYHRPFQKLLNLPISYLFLLFFSFISLFISMFLVQKFWYKRKFIALLTGRKYFCWKLALQAFLICILFIAFSSSIEYIFNILLLKDKSYIKFVYSPHSYWMYLPLVLLFIPVQSAAEEILFRGYLSQFFQQFLKSPLPVFLTTSLLFAIVHLSNGEARQDMLLYFLEIFFIGFFLSLLAYRYNGLEVSIAAHTANNLFTFSILGYPFSKLPATYLFETEIKFSIAILLFHIISYVILYFILDLLLKKYRCKE